MRLSLFMARALLGVALAAAPLAGNAAPMSGVAPADNALLLKVQHHPHGGAPHGRGGGHRGGDGGAAAAGALFGIFLGSMIAASEAQRQQAIEYCMRRYKSYDPNSMTYLGYDGVRHPCP